MNCEEYVVTKLINLEKTNDDKAYTIKALQMQIEDAELRIMKLERLIGTRTTYSSYVAKDGDVSLRFDAPWKMYETEDYNLMVECMQKYSKEEN